MPRSQPTRSAITVAGIEGVASNNRRISGSKLSITDPTAARSYLGGPDEANADATVFLEIPNCLAIARPDNRSDRCNRRISAQSSIVITLIRPPRHRRNGDDVHEEGKDEDEAGHTHNGAQDVHRTPRQLGGSLNLGRIVRRWAWG